MPERTEPMLLACPACGGRLGNGSCTQCGVQVFEPLPWWQRVVLGIAVAFVLVVNCAAVPVYLAFVVFLALRVLWRTRERRGRA